MAKAFGTKPAQARLRVRGAMTIRLERIMAPRVQGPNRTVLVG
jgi:hypothetical protein